MPTTQDSLLQSLLAAAEAAQSAYLTAQAANPGGNLTQLYVAEINAQALYTTALNKTFTGDAAADAEQQRLDALTNTIKLDLATLASISTVVTAVGDLVQLATTVGKFFV
jgi:hypothetical protein